MKAIVDPQVIYYKKLVLPRRRLPPGPVRARAVHLREQSEEPVTAKAVIAADSDGYA